MSDLSFYHKYCCAFARSHNGDLVSCTGPAQDELRKHLSKSSAVPESSPLQKFTATQDSVKTERKQGLQSSQSLAVKSPCEADTIQKGDELALYEKKRGDAAVGVLLKEPHAGDAEVDSALASLLLDQMRLFTTPAERPADAVAAAVAELFDAQLRYVTADDQWPSRGRALFLERVAGFVRRGEKIEFCLPAFPCKSSSSDKVGGTAPDRGEQIALQHLDDFVEAIEGVYEPGAKLWIVSDGHVFSDCIGVDDQTVDEYNAELKTMYAAIAARRGKERIGFKSLVDLLDLEQHSTAQTKAGLGLPQLTAHIATARTDAAELSRQLLVAGFGTDAAALRERIDARHPGTLRLYRGFSRFMLEDLSLNEYTRHLSRSRLRKLSSRVALEMMLRNDAYSNLVEALFPQHVRLSIHAHDNAGPKFGIRLFDAGVRPLETLDFDGPEMRSADLLHVPTPWHNSLVEVEGCDKLAMTKSGLVRDALESGKYAGGWVEGTNDGVAGRFRLRQPDAAPPKAEGRSESNASARHNSSDSDNSSMLSDNSSNDGSDDSNT